MNASGIWIVATKLHKKVPPMHPAVILCGSLGQERVGWEQLANEFGFRIETAASAEAVRPRQAVVALFLDLAENGTEPDALVRQAHKMIPEAKLVVCHGPADAEASAVDHAPGVFDCLTLPLAQGEVRQTFGFLWQALDRQREIATGQQLKKVVTISSPAPSRPSWRMQTA